MWKGYPPSDLPVPSFLYDISGAGRKKDRNKIMMNYLIVNLNGNMLGKKPTQTQKIYFKEGRTVNLAFHVKVNDDKG